MNIAQEVVLDVGAFSISAVPTEASFATGSSERMYYWRTNLLPEGYFYGPFKTVYDCGRAFVDFKKKTRDEERQARATRNEEPGQVIHVDFKKKCRIP